MKFLIDAQLPPSLRNCFRGYYVLHTSDLEKGNLTPDRNINSLSYKEDFVLITKDNDFYYSYIASKKPHKLVLVKLGNMKLRDLKAYFERNVHSIIKFLETNSFLILEPTRIRVLD